MFILVRAVLWALIAGFVLGYSVRTLVAAPSISNCENISTNRIVIDISLDRNAAILPAFDGRNLESASETSQLQHKFYISDSHGNSRPVWLFFSKIGKRAWKYFLMTEGRELQNYSKLNPADGLVILEQGLVEFFKDSSLRKVLPQHFAPDDFFHLKPGEQSVFQPSLKDEFESSIRFRGAEPISHLRIEYGQSKLLPGGILESTTNEVRSAEAYSSYSRFCPSDYLQDKDFRSRPTD